jgi:hypothetical protein
MSAINFTFEEKRNMNTKLVFLAFLMTALFACQADPENGGENGGNDQPKQEQQEVPGNPVADSKDGVVSPQTQRLINALSTGYWAMEVYVKIQDRPADAANRGKWFNFNPDGTYTSGRWDKETGKGVWEYTAQEAKIWLDPEGEDEPNMEFTLKMSSDESIMIWVGTERYNQNNIQIKMGNYLDLPSKEVIKMPKIEK